MPKRKKKDDRNFSKKKDYKLGDKLTREEINSILVIAFIVAMVVGLILFFDYMQKYPEVSKSPRLSTDTFNIKTKQGLTKDSEYSNPNKNLEIEPKGFIAVYNEDSILDKKYNLKNQEVNLQKELLDQEDKINQLNNQLKIDLRNSNYDFEINREYSLVVSGASVKGVDREFLENLPYVKSVYPNNRVKASLMDSIRVINADDVWKKSANGYGCLPNDELPYGTEKGECLTGEGTTIAILDSGIDYTHKDFGGDGKGYLHGHTIFEGKGYNWHEQSIDDNKVIAQRGRFIFLYDLEKEKGVEITGQLENPERTFWEAYSPHIHGNHAVWIEEHTDNTLCGGICHRKIIFYDLSIDSDGDNIPNYLEEQRPNPDPAKYIIKVGSIGEFGYFTPYYLNTKVYDNVILWEYSVLGYINISTYDLDVDSDGNGIPNYMENPGPNPDPALRDVVSVYYTNTDNLNPDIYEDYIVFDKAKNLVGLYDLSNGQEPTIITN